MMSDNTATDPSSGLLAKLNLIFLLIVLGAVVVGTVGFMGGLLVENIERLSNDNIYVLVSKWDIPAFIGLPCFVVIIWGLLLRLLNKATDARIQWCVNFCIVPAIAAVVVRVFYGFVVDGYMASHGYTYCWEYTSPSAMSPSVWVKEPEFCISNSGSVRREVLSWMDSRPNWGKDVSVEEVEAKVAMLLKEWKREQDRY